MLDRPRLRSLANASESERTRDVGTLWDTVNLLAWSRYALAPMQRTKSLDVVATDAIRAD